MSATLAERTFGGGLGAYLAPLKSCHMPEEPEFARINSGIFESDDLVEMIYRIYLSLVTQAWKSGGLTERVADLGFIYRNGVYLPCTERIVLAGQVDVTNDSLPSYAGLTVVNTDKVICIGARAARPPRGIIVPASCHPYAVTLLFESNEHMARADRRAGVTEAADLTFVTRYISVNPSGALVPCKMPRFSQTGGDATPFGLFCQMAALAINASVDARHLWLVETDENILGETTRTPLRLGVSEEHIKSLFYARQAPVTESGRRRPIMHWVQAHRRRLRAGIDVDVIRHLRGVDTFEMEGFRFQITNPTKVAR